MIANTGNPSGTTTTVQTRIGSDTTDPVGRRQRAVASITPQGGPFDGARGFVRQSACRTFGTVGSGKTGARGSFDVGPDEAAGVTVVFTLRRHLYISATLPPHTCLEPTTREVTCALPETFAPGSMTSALVQFSLDGVATGTIDHHRREAFDRRRLIQT